jgi:Protein of unknown function (DUF3108)
MTVRLTAARLPAALLCALSTAVAAEPAPGATAATAAACPPAKLRPVRLTAGETLAYKLDVLGADVGTFELAIENAPPADRAKGAALLVKSRARTSAFVSTNVKRYEAYATALVNADLAALSYHEETDEGEVHRTIDATFPSKDGRLPVTSMKNGEPEKLDLAATPSARDMLSLFYLLRAQRMEAGTPFCAEIFAGRRMWKLEGAVATKETIDTPIGRVPTVRITAKAFRIDAPHVSRTAHFWVTDDERKLPVVAIGDVRGKMIRAQLTSVTAPGLVARKAGDKKSARVGAAIGR